MKHDLTAARKNARTEEDAAAIAWADEELERLRQQNSFLEQAITKVIEDVKAALRNSTAEILDMERARSIVASRS